MSAWQAKLCRLKSSGLFLYQVGTVPFGIGLVDDKVYVANWGSQFEPSSVYVAATFDNTVWILNSDLSHRSTLNAADGIGQGPFSLAEDPVLRRIYVGNKGDGTLSVLDACTGQISVNLSFFLPIIAK